MIQNRRLNSAAEFEQMLSTEVFLLRENNITIPEDQPFPDVEEITRKRRYMWKQKSLMLRGFYSLQLKEWMKEYTLGKDLLVVRYERFKEEPQAVLDEICDFVGLPRYEFHEKHINKTYVPLGMWKNVTIDHTLRDVTKEYLQRVFKPYNDELADLLGEEWRGVYD
jgi:Sulfotransferase domain